MTTGGAGWVPAGLLGAALARQWREVASALGPTNLPWQVHAATTIVHAGGLRAADLETDLEALARSAPGRLIVIVEEPSRRNGIRGQAAIACQVDPASGAQLCRERITLRLPAGAAGLESVLLALRVPDVPTGLWWLGEPPWDSPGSEILAGGDIAETVLVDSARFTEPASGFARLALAVEAGWPIRDLNWLRTRRWREVIAGCFDDPEWALRLPSLKAITVTSSAAQAAAGLIAAWFGVRLGLAATGRPSELEGAGGRIVRIDLRDQPGKPVGLRAVRLDFDDRDEGVAVELEYESSCLSAALVIEGRCARERATRLPNESDGTLVGRAVTGERGPSQPAEQFALAAKLLGSR